MAGVHILQDHGLKGVGERFGWGSKKQIFDLLHKHKKSNVLFVSGDVHYGQIYLSPCEHKLGYRIPEVCSSGMSHALDGYKVLLGLGGYIIDLITPFLYGATLPGNFKHLNYGKFEIDPDSKKVDL